jgi:hypothetical protein
VVSLVLIIEEQLLVFFVLQLEDELQRLHLMDDLVVVVPIVEGLLYPLRHRRQVLNVFS